MSNSLDRIVDVVLALKSDPELKECFSRVLRIGSSTQQVRVSLLIEELKKRGAPVKILEFAQALSNEKIAQLVLQELDN